MSQNVLLHICCAPCSVAVVEELRKEVPELAGFWYNPNIHPVTEYRMRRDTLQSYAAQIGLPLIVDDTYGLRAFCAAVGTDYDNRCGKCYEMRMFETARRAAEGGYSAFCTTLLVSPYQNREALLAVCRRAASEFGVSFLERDFRPFFRSGQTRAAEAGLYRQKYCGCIFSEEERYRKKQIQREKEKSTRDR